MRVLYVYDGAWPKGATRVRKETRALAARGHEVTLLARNQENAPARQREPWMDVRRLPRFPIPLLRYALNFPLFVNPVWLFAIWRAVQQARPDRILVCDLPLAPCAVWIGRIARIPVHFDMGEVYPEFLRSLRLLERQGPLKRLIRSPTAAEWLERYVLRNVAVVFVVSEESRNRCVQLGVTPDRLVVVGNTPEQLPDLQQAFATPTDIADLVDAGREILLFVGILIADRGVLDAVRAMPSLLRRRPKAALVVVGDGPARAALELEVERSGLASSVRIVGWKLPDELDAYYRSSHLGLLPFLDSPHVRLTLANKLFDYMGAALPVLGSDLPPTRRVLMESRAGRLHRPNDAEDLARVAAELLEDEPGRLAMGRSGRQAAEFRYSWQRDADRLCEGVTRSV